MVFIAIGKQHIKFVPLLGQDITDWPIGLFPSGEYRAGLIAVSGSGVLTCSCRLVGCRWKGIGLNWGMNGCQENVYEGHVG